MVPFGTRGSVAVDPASVAAGLPLPRRGPLPICTRCGTHPDRPGHLPRELLCRCGSVLAFDRTRSRFFTASEIGADRDATFNPVDQPRPLAWRRQQ